MRGREVRARLLSPGAARPGAPAAGAGADALPRGRRDAATRTVARPRAAARRAAPRCWRAAPSPRRAAERDDRPAARHARAARAAAHAPPPRAVALDGGPARRRAGPADRPRLRHARGGRVARARSRARLRARPGVAHVEVERRHELRFVPNDPALTTPETAPRTPPGTRVQWWVARMGLPAPGTSRAATGATVAVIDTGVDGGHPELAGKIARGDRQRRDARPRRRRPATRTATARTSPRWPARPATTASGIAGAGLTAGCIVVKSDLSDGSVAALDRRRPPTAARDAINMSFGTDGSAPAARRSSDAIDYAVDHGRRARRRRRRRSRSRSRATRPTSCSRPAPARTSPPAAGCRSPPRTSSTSARRSPGRGSQISLAAYGAFDQRQSARAGSSARSPATPTELESGGSALFPQPAVRLPHARSAATTATPTCRARRWRRRSSRRVAALVRDAQPRPARAADVIRAAQADRARARRARGWTPELGWGIVDAGAALSAAARDRPPRRRVSLRGRGRAHARAHVTLRWTRPRRRAPAGVRAVGRRALRASGARPTAAPTSAIKRTRERRRCASASRAGRALPLLHDRRRPRRQPRGAPAAPTPDRPRRWRALGARPGSRGVAPRRRWRARAARARRARRATPRSPSASASRSGSAS